MDHHWVYVTLSNEDKIAIFMMDRDSGRLDFLDTVAVPGLPAPMALDPSRRFLFVGRRGDLKLSTFSIDENSGRLSHIAAISVDSDPCYLATDRNGRYLFSAYYSAGRVGVHGISDDGTLDEEPTEWLETAPGAHCIQADESNQFVFVPHIAGSTGPNMILQFRFDEDTGRLTPNSPHRVTPDHEDGPRHFCFHPFLGMVYFSDEQGSSVTAYKFDSDLGTLMPVQTVSTLPRGTYMDNTCAQIQILPSGRALYAPNRGHNTIACFSVDSSGRLERIDNVPTEPVPRAFSLDPTGNFLLAAGLESGRLAEYRICQATGQLEPVETYDVGGEPMWILIVDTE